MENIIILGPDLLYSICKTSPNLVSELQIKGGIEDNSKIIFLISQRKHVVAPH